MGTMRVRLFPVLLVMLATTCFFTGQADAWPIPDTGQTQSYTTTFGEDSDYTINPPSYTKLGQDGVELPDVADSWVMVRDNVTGLIWEVKTAANRDSTYTWTGAFAYVDSLNASNFGGFSDWRLPSRKELRSIVDHGRYNPSINTAYFTNTKASYYWSSTTHASHTDYAWSMYFYYGSDYSHSPKSLIYYVRAVRGGQ